MKKSLILAIAATATFLCSHPLTAQNFLVSAQGQNCDTCQRRPHYDRTPQTSKVNRELELWEEVNQSAGTIQDIVVDSVSRKNLIQHKVKFNGIKLRLWLKVRGKTAEGQIVTEFTYVELKSKAVRFISLDGFVFSFLCLNGYRSVPMNNRGELTTVYIKKDDQKYNLIEEIRLE